MKFLWPIRHHISGFFATALSGKYYTTLPRALLHDPKSAYSPFCCWTSMGITLTEVFTEVSSFSKRQCIPLGNMKLHATSLIKYFSEIFVTLLVQTAAHLPDEDHAACPIWPLLLLKCTSWLRTNCAPMVAEKTRHNRGKIIECVVEYKNKAMW